MIQDAYFIITDISGYTAYLTKSELDHAQDILKTLFDIDYCDTYEHVGEVPMFVHCLQRRGPRSVRSSGSSSPARTPGSASRPRWTSTSQRDRQGDDEGELRLAQEVEGLLAAEES